MQHSKRRALAALALTLGLTACDIPSPATLMALNRFDPLTTDPSELQVAVRIPDGFQAKGNSVTLLATLEETETDPEVTREFQIAQSTSKAEVLDLEDGDGTLKVFSMRPEDAEALRAFQRQAQRAKEEDRGGSISIDAQVCRLTETVPSTAILSAYLKSEETKRFVPLIENFDILSEVTEKDLEDIAPMCGV